MKWFKSVWYVEKYREWTCSWGETSKLTLSKSTLFEIQSLTLPRGRVEKPFLWSNAQGLEFELDVFFLKQFWWKTNTIPQNRSRNGSPKSKKHPVHPGSSPVQPANCTTVEISQDLMAIAFSKGPIPLGQHGARTPTVGLAGRKKVRK